MLISTQTAALSGIAKSVRSASVIARAVHLRQETNLLASFQDLLKEQEARLNLSILAPGDAVVVGDGAQSYQLVKQALYMHNKAQQIC